MHKAHCTLGKIQWQSLKLTDVHTNLHLTLTALQFAFSLHSVSVSYLCYILWYKHHYDCSHCAQPKRNQWNTNCKWPNITPPTHRGIGPGKWVRWGGNLEALATSSDSSKLSLHILHNRWHECIQPLMHQISTNHRLVLIYMNLEHNVFSGIYYRHIVGGKCVNSGVLRVKINSLTPC